MAGTKKKSLQDMIIAAIRNTPPGANGVSRSAITKYLKSEFEYDKANLIKNSLKKAVSSGKLIQNGQSFLVAGDPMPEREPEAQVEITDIKEGKGEPAKDGDTVVVKYEGKLDDGTTFDKASSFEFTLGLGEVIKGWDQGVLNMKVGGKRQLFVPSKLGYGKRGASPEIPPNADLHFKITLKEIK
ncbi:FK506-binding protein 2 [Chaetoceros tenuissimus]|uniref:peptidylprolyl isomerase n=1 Tax=Chaetoceros tenuissimus TaxID=426638 RepID=A0AAD3D284_9STRA|nr:FK506-binding protein 2 [Chaetoceros tenuissimus]